jgi:hypothetical protein
MPLVPFSRTFNLKNLTLIVLALTSFLGVRAEVAFPDNLVSNVAQPGAFPLVSKGNTATLWVDANDYKGVVRAVGDLQSDIERVTGKKPEVFIGNTTPSVPVIIGTLGKSRLIDKLVKARKLNTSDLKGKWESHVIATVENPMAGVKQALVLVGSDKRGTIYGIYELSKQLGVSPWYWWADVPAKRRNEAYIRSGYFSSGEPKVKYRGIFINDENPALQTWARTHFGGMNSKMYSHMFELLLRLKGNCLWPGMWGSFKEYKPLVPILKDENGNWEGNCFNEDDLENPRLADEYGIVMGTSHHEPMQRSQQEWIRHKSEYGNGEWNYQTNKEGLQRFFRDGIQNTKNYESLITIGMRGDEDRPMVDAGSAEANFKILEGIIDDQRQIIKNVAGKSVSKLQQVWTLYSEVLEYFDQGMKVPDDVIICLCDDNWGNVRYLPKLNEKKHPGGYGMYYHAGYYGAPRACKWLSVNQIQHMWEQLQATYDYGVDKLWIINVGDLKPMEFPMDFFMKMAWNPKAFNESNLINYTRSFCAQQFGEEEALEAASILNDQCHNTSRVTPEMLDDKTYNLESGEFKMVRDEYLALEARALRQFLTLPDAYKDGYKELILFPVQAMANLYDMYYAVAQNKKLATEKDPLANRWADQVEACFKRDSILCADYNHNIADGKWNQIMIQPHIGYTSWSGPQYNIMPKVTRVEPVEAKSGGYIFNLKNRVVVMEAEHFYEVKTPVGTKWTILPDLGRNLSCLALMPYTKSVEGASLTYKMDLEDKPKTLKVNLILRTTMPFIHGGHRVTASVNGGTEKVININDQLTWKNNYSKMYPTAAARIIEVNLNLDAPESSDGMYTLTFRPLEPGVVFQKVIVDEGGYESTYLKMLESPYRRQ